MFLQLLGYEIDESFDYGCSVLILHIVKLCVTFQAIMCSISPGMASVSAARFVSWSSYLSSAGATGSDSKTVLTHNDLKNQPTTHSGLRSLNKLDMLQIRTNARAASGQLRRKALKTEVESPVGVIKCGTGMNLIFVGAEVGPWSKTGGLGDVLGGLPPAMAVSMSNSIILFLFIDNSLFWLLFTSSNDYGHKPMFYASSPGKRPSSHDYMPPLRSV